MTGTFFEHMELDDFPLDVQRLSVVIAFNCAKEGIVPVRFEPVAASAALSINLETFALSNLWTLYPYLAVEPTFPIKLFHLVCNTLTDSAISWTQSGDAFVITDPDMFAREILPTYFKHNNIRSLERQLNIYGFKRRTDLQTHVRKHIEFSHEKFRRDEPWLLTQIKRSEAKRSGLTSRIV